MKIAAFISLLVVFVAPRVTADNSDGDWGFLKQHLTEWHEERHPKPGYFRDRINSFRFLPRVLQFMQNADSVEVIEGLPHQNWEPELLKSELAKVDELIIGKFPFYPEKQPLRVADKPSLDVLLKEARGFTPYLGPFMCGGFHPDYVVRFRKGKKHCDMLLCFGCAEIKIIYEKIFVECSPKKGWKEILEKYSKHRPEPKHKTTKTKQGGADQLATAPESKSESNSNPQIESEVRPQ